jgi:signal transduction histidine kinase
MSRPAASRFLPLRSLRTRSTSLVAILLLTMGLAAFLAYEAWDAARSHRLTAERTIRDYARFAAWEFSANTKEHLHSTLAFVFSPVAKLDPRWLMDDLPAPDILGGPKVAHLQCTGDSSRYYFRLDLRRGHGDELVTSGDVPSPVMLAWIRDTVTAHARHVYDPDWGYAAIFGTVGGESRAVAYQLLRDTHGKGVAAYGFEFCVADFAAPSFRKVMGHYAVLPPSLTGGIPNDSVPNDSLLSVVVADLHGHELFRSGVQYPPRFTGEHQLDYFGGLRTIVTLRPELAEQLVIGGLPRSRLPVVFGVLVLTVGLAVIGLVQLRREGELARLRSDFIASVSHELRTPLAQVRMFAETLLLGRVRSEEERVRSLRIVDQEARRLTHLVENILQFSRAERRAIRLTPAPVAVAAQVREGVEGFAPVARARRVAVRLELDDDAVAMADASALRQILLNLLDNAVKYGPAGQTVTVGVVRRSSGSDAVVRLWVEDEGPGVAPRERERVWEAFYRLERDVHSAVAGSGIGLAVVRELVALQGGRVWVEDAPAAPERRAAGAAPGARFVVELPGAHAAPRERAAEGSPAGEMTPVLGEPPIPATHAGPGGNGHHA